MHRDASDDPYTPAPELRDETRRRFVSGAFEASRVVRAAGTGDQAAESFRERLRAEFASGDLEQRARDREQLTEALGASPGAAFKSRLRAQFVLGALETEEAPTEVPAAPEPQLAPVHDLSRARRRLGPALVAGILAAAAILLTTLPTALGPDWATRPDAQVTGATFNRGPLSAGREIPARTDRVLACGPEALRLSLEDRARVQISPAAQIRFCAPVWTLFGRVRAPVHLDTGTLDVQTLAGEESLDLVVEAPNAEIHLDRGAMSVKVMEAGTCVVVDSGTATIDGFSGESITVTEGQRVFVPRHGGDLEHDPSFVEASPDAGARLKSLREMLVDVDAGVF